MGIQISIILIVRNPRNQEFHKHLKFNKKLPNKTMILIKLTQDLDLQILSLNLTIDLVIFNKINLTIINKIQITNFQLIIQKKNPRLNLISIKTQPTMISNSKISIILEILLQSNPLYNKILYKINLNSKIKKNTRQVF